MTNQTQESPLPSTSDASIADPAVQTPGGDTPAKISVGTEAPNPQHNFLNGIIVILEGMERRLQTDFQELARHLRDFITLIKNEIK